MKKIFSKLNIITIIIISIIIAVIFELTIGNINYYLHPKGTKDVTSIELLTKEKNLEVRVHVNQYVRELQLKMILNGQDKKKYTTYVEKENGKQEMIKEEFLYPYYDGDYFIKIDKEAKSIVLKFENTLKSEISLEYIKSNNNLSFNMFSFLIISFISFIILYFTLKIIRREKLKFHKIFLIIAIPISIIYALMNPLYYSLDEEQHLVRAYNISNGNFNLDKGELTKWPTALENVIDDPSDIVVPTTYNTYSSYMKYLTDLGNSPLKEKYHSSTAEPYLFPAYVVSGLGIFVAKMFHLSFPIQFYLGRIFNSIFFCILMYFAIKLSGKFNKIFFMIALLPLILFQGASYSADMLTNAFSILSISLTLYYRNRKEKIKTKELALLTSSYILSFISKVAYFPIVLLIYLIPNKQFETKRSEIISKIAIPLIIFIFLGIAFLYANGHGIVQWLKEGINAREQVKFILLNPLKYIKVIFTTFNINFVNLLITATIQLGYGGHLGSINLFILLIGFVIAISSCYESDLKWKDKLWLAVITIGCILVSMTSIYVSYNIVGNSIVDGFQGRYLVPVIIPFFLLFCSKKFRLETREKNTSFTLIFISVFLNLYGIGMLLYKFYF